MSKRYALILMLLVICSTMLVMPVLAAGTIVSWGDNIGTPPAGNNYVAIAAGGFHSLALKNDGSIVGWGLNSNGQATPPAGNNYVAIAAGNFYSLALTHATGGEGVNAPEFPSTILPATMIIGFLGAILYIKKTREH